MHLYNYICVFKHLQWHYNYQYEYINLNKVLKKG
jgi:hypothetical protein